MRPITEEQEIARERNMKRGHRAFKLYGLMFVAFGLFCAYLLGFMDGMAYRA